MIAILGWGSLVWSPGELKTGDVPGKQESIGARIGRIVSYPSSATGNVKRHRFAIALMVLAVFVMQLVFVLPDDSRRWFVAGYAFVMVVVAAWQLELAKER